MLLTVCDKVWKAISLNNVTSKPNDYGYDVMTSSGLIKARDN